MVSKISTGTTIWDPYDEEYFDNLNKFGNIKYNYKGVKKDLLSKYEDYVYAIKNIESVIQSKEREKNSLEKLRNELREIWYTLYDDPLTFEDFLKRKE